MIRETWCVTICLARKMLGFIAKKEGMTQIFHENGDHIPVTVLSVSSNTVVQVKTSDKDGYNAIQVGCGEQKESRLSKAAVNHYKKAGTKAAQTLKEFRTEKAVDFKPGFTISAASCAAGEKVNIQGVSKGKGFAGVMKRYHFAGGCDSHGNSVAHRVPGSIGQNTYPGKVIKGKKLPGHMGDKNVTVKNLEIVGIEAVDENSNLVMIRGAVPGAKGSWVLVYPHADDFTDKVISANVPAESEAKQATEAPAEKGDATA